MTTNDPQDLGVLGVVTDPGEPAEVAAKHLGQLSEVLAARLGESSWRVQSAVETLPPLAEGYDELVDVARRHMDGRGWDAVVCLTDSPMRDGKDAIVADLLDRTPLAIVSLPAFGLMRFRRHVGPILAELGQALARDSAEQSGPAAEPEEERTATRGGDFHRLEPADPDVQLRITASRARFRLLLGLVRANRPWRLLGGLKGAVAAAVATAAYMLIVPTIWQFADQLGVLRLALATVLAIAGMVTWLIVSHGLWAKSGRQQSRERLRLFNISTVLTLSIGVLCAWALLLVANLLAVLLLIDPGFYRSQVQNSAAFTDYLTLACFTASLALIAGALGSGFESDEAVRQAAYSQREQQRQRTGQDSADW